MAFLLSFTMPSTKILMVAGLVVVILVFLYTIRFTGNVQGFSNMGAGEAKPSFTLYYMKGCPHCDEILPEFRTFASSGMVLSNGGTVKINHLEQATAEGQQGVNENQIKGFPSFILKKADGTNVPYEGDRTVSAYKAFITKNVS
jgi:hypothetical protein